MISSFSELVNAALQQEDAQRLLMLFANAESTTKKATSTQHGTINPVMCVDKLPGDIASFDQLVVEADGMSKDWNLILVAGLSGKGDRAPTTEEADPFLNQMANDLTAGLNIAKYVVFDRSGNAVSLQAS